MPVQFLNFPTGAALYDPEKVSPGALAALIARGLKQSSTPMGGCAGREGVRLIEERSSSWVWRHNRRGGWCGRIIRDSYVWLGATRTRAFREWQLLHHLRHLGLPVPTPVAAFYERRGLVYRSDLITGLLPGTESFGAKLQRGKVDLALWRSVGSCIRCFHAHGIYHADLNVHNILIGTGDQVYLIDFDRGAIRQPGSWIEANWSRLRRSINKVCRELPDDRFGEAEWLALRHG